MTGLAPTGVEIAGALARLLAAVIDLALFGLASLTLLLVLGASMLAPDGTIRSPAVSPLFLPLLPPAATWLFWTAMGATPGKWVCGLRIVRAADAGPIGAIEALTRLIGYGVSFLLPLGFLWIAIDRRRRGWHDLIAGTLVIRTA